MPASSSSLFERQEGKRKYSYQREKNTCCLPVQIRKGKEDCLREDTHTGRTSEIPRVTVLLNESWERKEGRHEETPTKPETASAKDQARNEKEVHLFKGKEDYTRETQSIEE